MNKPKGLYMFKSKINIINEYNDWSNIEIKPVGKIKHYDKLPKEINIMIRKWNMSNIAEALHIAKNLNSNFKLSINKNNKLEYYQYLKNDTLVLHSYLSISSAIYNFKIPSSMCFIYDDILKVYHTYLYENRLVNVADEIDNFNNLNLFTKEINNNNKDIYIGYNLDLYINKLYKSVGFRTILLDMSYNDSTLPNFYVLKETLGNWLGKETKKINDYKIKKILTCVFRLMKMKIPNSYLYIDLEVYDWMNMMENENVIY